MYKCAIVLAAGEGKRMNSNTPKMLHKVCGKEMINHVIDTIRSADIETIDVVIGRGAEKVKKATEDRKISYSVQEEQLGTGHAVMCAKEFLGGHKGTVAIFVGDGPLITETTVRELLDYHEKGKFKATILTSTMNDPGKYGRIIRSHIGEVEKIVEFKDCNPYELAVKEINSGMYCFNIEELLSSLDKLNNNNAQREYYLTDVIGILKGQGFKVGAFDVPIEEITAVNSKVELADAELIMKARINRKHMENGVTIMDPNNTYIDWSVIIGKDTIIYPGNILQGTTIIKENCVLYQNNRIVDSIIQNGVSVQSSVIIESQVGEETTVGPYAYIRPESIIGKHARIGDFVEIKKSTIGDNTKVSHLTYIGDAEVGSGCNFGCGTVVVNYDGKSKFKTIIGNNTFIGCNANLVSPVKINDNAYIAAGSTITNEVPKNALAIARARQVNIENWVVRKGHSK
ncbi:MULTISPECIES: bifunctional UDP-N-acetylglucosamine diphosphorylase/glucosamine-1-phosphate N-acetyltransferase GlmU [Clostridium]|uniref:bifunctional UDP-N-acetylglucosamine diphosphorylase/glucosamine-1-phosphate N-acetyltransferase GlmU n=1 Tax=Clostridium TaxID=1485 RepID=UPI0013E91B28|nr:MULTISPECIES: bifunctional UDP-N-acetylglucosamine diphosphorylase/glucosamine-1-phosphate N-acetyltransferase GlmU [Clostridium]MBW9156249.1 bifunctional UDP-N-acetylglucosamine diphosphorylase/glucosamine-1-phosphate N-acetyltransferase GlmU [Clostridium tagluense]MBZ9625761.1 bifunctional UDP-N-acetylglucosamine diphosphorylase/glucosamine-1-phosphate N-acetyltransferase GlmU [Clostridium sp. FP2]MBZ9637171.1 bifunctional UDP-N-acetylglucosamine diphosphorylase/glucosamine-1-phosphate N-ac